MELSQHENTEHRTSLSGRRRHLEIGLDYKYIKYYPARIAAHLTSLFENLILLNPNWPTTSKLF
jgi:hypothetical protein